MERNNDSKGRWRNKYVTFRVSQEEAEMINHMVALSGLKKTGLYCKKASGQGCYCSGQSQGI